MTGKEAKRGVSQGGSGASHWVRLSRDAGGRARRYCVWFLENCWLSLTKEFSRLEELEVRLQIMSN